MACIRWQAVPESSWYLNAILRCFLRAVYGNVVFSRSKLHALHKSLVFFRSLLLPAVANLMFCVYCLHILLIFVRFCACALQSVAAVPESSWYFNAIFRCFLRAVYGNVVFLRCLLTRVWCFNAMSRCFLRAVYGNVVFSLSKRHARHKCLVLFRSLSICSCSLRLCKALRGFGRY